MDAKLYGSDGKAKGNASLPDALFGQQVHEHLLWLSAKRHLGDQRQGTAKVKAKGEVSGGGKKPFKQKGTGRARQGSNTSPLMPGGGRSFGPKPRGYRTEMPKKQRRAALEKLHGIEDRISIRVAGFEPVYAIADEDLDRENERKTSSVHFLRFELDAASRQALRAGVALSMGVDHPAYQALEQVAPQVRDSLSRDLVP